VPFSIALSSDEYDPWTETSHKFRFYDQPVLVRSDPQEVEVGTIQEVLVYADEGSQFFEPLPTNKLSLSSGESDSFDGFSAGLSGITCQFGRFGET
jgi:hypothetical protein